MSDKWLFDDPAEIERAKQEGMDLAERPLDAEEAARAFAVVSARGPFTAQDWWEEMVESLRPRTAQALGGQLASKSRRNEIVRVGYRDGLVKNHGRPLAVWRKSTEVE